MASGRIAIITGAGSGIGRNVALALSRRGYRLALAGRRHDPLEAVVDACAGGAVAIPTDVCDAQSVAQLFSSTVAQFGRVDLLFNNAGVSGGGPIDEISLDAWRRVIDTNLTGAFLCLQAAFRQMKVQVPRGGRIINNGSISAHAPRPFSAPYTASKHAITGLTKSAGLDGRAFDIAVCQIDIGNAATEMASRMAAGVPQASGVLAPEPLMDVAHVGEAIAFMDSLPLDANIPFMTLLATKMPYLGRG